MSGAEVMAAKDEVRRRTLARRHALDPAWVAQASAAIGRHVSALDEFRRAGTVAAYLAMAQEVQTQGLVAACRTAGKQVAVPAFCSAAGVYRWAWLRSGDPVAAGRGRVAEPANPDWVSAAVIDLALVPGVAFDRSGNRLGHGRGWYDRLLAPCGVRVTCRAGLGFEFQLVPHVPADEHDIRMDLVITECGVVRVRADEGRSEVGTTGRVSAGKGGPS